MCGNLHSAHLILVAQTLALRVISGSPESDSVTVCKLDVEELEGTGPGRAEVLVVVLLSVQGIRSGVSS